MSLQFQVIAGPDKDRVFTLRVGPNATLGRGRQSLYHVSDPRVSRVHCQLLLDGDQVTLIDTSSSGTFVNGKKVARHTLKLGDVVRIGDTQLRLQMADLPTDEAVGLVAPAGSPRPPNAEKPLGQLAELSGRTLAHFKVGPVLGKGHIGIVFQASDVKDGKTVALKVLQPEFSKSDEEMQRFVRAIKTILRLRHPNLVILHAAGRTKPYCWISMEYIDGESLTQTIERIGVAGMLDWRYALRVAVQIGRALAYAHEEQIVHRNVAPTNILLQKSDKTAKLGDLMLSKAIEGSLAQQITRPGELVGDVAYMSPERTHGTGELDGRSDIYGRV